MADRVVVALDGGFVEKKLTERLHHFPAAADVTALVATMMTHARLTGTSLLRVFYYDCPPFEGQAKNPLSGAIVNLGTSAHAKMNKALLDQLEMKPDFAVRRGVVITTGWELGHAALRDLTLNGPRAITATDLVPALLQKGVDMRIGLDLALIALKRIAEIVVLVTGDSDLVPIMKFARTEGMRVYLNAMGHSVKRDLVAHADFSL